MHPNQSSMEVTKRNYRTVQDTIDEQGTITGVLMMPTYSQGTPYDEDTGFTYKTEVWDMIRICCLPTIKYMGDGLS